MERKLFFEKRQVLFMRRSFLLFSLFLAGLVLIGCDEKRQLTILFTSDVNAWLTPAG